MTDQPPGSIPELPAPYLSQPADPVRNSVQGVSATTPSLRRPKKGLIVGLGIGALVVVVALVAALIVAPLLSKGPTLANSKLIKIFDPAISDLWHNSADGPYNPQDKIATSTSCYGGAYEALRGARLAQDIAGDAMATRRVSYEGKVLLYASPDEARSAITAIDASINGCPQMKVDYGAGNGINEWPASVVFKGDLIGSQFSAGVSVIAYGNVVTILFAKVATNGFNGAGSVLASNLKKRIDSLA